MNKNYYIREDFDKFVSNDLYQLHNHEIYEIYVFGEGDANYIVEGASYDLESGDMILIRPYEMHKIQHKSVSKYRRTIVEIEESFFNEEGIEEYKGVFTQRRSGEKNKISASACKELGITDCLERIKKYSGGYKNIYNPLVRSCFLELLYLINSSEAMIRSAEDKSKVRDVIEYINENFKEDLSLYKIAERFYLSKEYLCRVFKKSTGFTVEEFIKRKRIMEAEKLHQEGKSLSLAAREAGFSDYSVFYKAYVKLKGVSPKEGMK